jgi:FixJ family two-component response regulator
MMLSGKRGPLLRPVPVLALGSLMTQRIVAVIDNDSSLLKALNRLLTAHGYVVHPFSSAEGFLLSDTPRKASCLVLDIHLDGMSGLELRRELTRTGSAIPVIFMTAYDSVVSEQQARELGCVAYLLKPFSAAVLVEAIEQGGV